MSECVRVLAQLEDEIDKHTAIVQTHQQIIDDVTKARDGLEDSLATSPDFWKRP
jgi:hypothetical protein